MSDARPEISLAICTFDRAASLALVLDDLVAQRSPPARWELLVVDNASTDATRQVAERFGERLPLRLVDEPRQGLSHARNRAVEAARGDVLLFTDDDVRLEPDWLAAFALAFAQHPQAAFFGGRVSPDWGGATPRWFRAETAEQFAGVLVAFDRGETTRPLGADEPLPIGASLAFRLEALRRCGPFRTDLGVVGRGRGRGEETELLQRLVAGGRRGAYVGEARCRHPVRRDALKLRPLYAYGVESGVAFRRMTPVGDEQRSPGVSGYLLRGLYQLLKGRGDRFRQCVMMAGVAAGARREARAAGPTSTGVSR